MTVAAVAVAFAADPAVVGAVEDLVGGEPVDAEHARPPRRPLPLLRRLVLRLVPLAVCACAGEFRVKLCGK